MNKKIALGVVGLVAIAGVAGVAASTTYARGGMMRGNGMMGNATSTAAVSAQRDAMIAQHDAMEQAALAGDYTTWKAAADKLEANRPAGAQGKAMTSVITEANFAKFVEMHKLMQQADTIRTELGLDQNGMGQGMRNGMMRGGRGMGHRFATSTAVTNQ